MATINGTFNSLIGGTISGTVATPGATGPAGPTGATGATGPAGAPGVGVPAGGTAGQFLTKTTTGVDYATGWTTLSLSGYATESWVTAGFYPLTGNPASFATESWVTSQGYATESWVTSQGFVGVGYVEANFYPLVGNPDNFTTSAAIFENGGTFLNKVTFTSVSQIAGLNIGIGGSSAWATEPGDIWIPTAGTNLNFRDGNGIARVCASTTSGNTFNQPQNVDTSNVLPALRVTQRGTGNALLVEDSTTPDTSALVVDASGNVGVGVATGYTSTSKFEVVGNVKGTTLSTASGPVFSVNSIVSHTGGSDTNDLLVTIGGVNYRIGMRIV